MNQKHLIRFSGIIPLDDLKEKSVCIVGAGGIGAPAAICMAKSGIRKMTIFDFDKVEDENIGPQIYGPEDLGKQKVSALAEIVQRFAPWCEVNSMNTKFKDHNVNYDVLVSAVDSLKVRKMIWNNVSSSNEKPEILIDPRMGAELLTVYSVDPCEDKLWYEQTLEGEAMEASCTTKATFYTGFVAGALCMQAVKAWLCGHRNLVEFNFDMYNLVAYGMTKKQIYESV